MVASEGVRWRVGSEDDLGTVFADAFDEVYRYAARLTGRDRDLAEDLVQEAFVALVRAIRAGEMHEVGVGWLITAVRNRFIDHVRHQRTASRVLRFRPAHAIESAEGGSATAAVALIDPHERLVLMLHHVDGHPVREVASMIGKSVHATESILARARRSARDVFSQEQRHD